MGYKISKSIIYLHLVYLLILIYAYLDFQSSALTGIRDADRSLVYIVLSTVIVVLGIHYLYTSLFKGIAKDSVECSLWLITGWIAFVSIAQETNLWALLVQLGISLLWVLTYSFARNDVVYNSNTLPIILKWIIVLFFFYVYAAVYASYNISLLYERIAVVNLSYYAIVFFPWISLISKKNIKLIMYFFILTIVLISFKRGALIIFPLMTITYLIVKAKIEGKMIRNLVTITTFAIFFTIGIIVVDSLAGGFLLDRFTMEALESGSGRAVLYSNAIDDIVDRSFIDLLMGEGSGSSEEALGKGAHNEWLEFMFNYGLIGTIFYAVWVLSLFMRLRKLIKKRSKYSPAYVSAIIYILLVGMFGSLYFSHSTFYIMAFLGTVEGLILKNELGDRAI